MFCAFFTGEGVADREERRGKRLSDGISTGSIAGLQRKRVLDAS